MLDTIWDDTTLWDDNTYWREVTNYTFPENIGFESFRLTPESRNARSVSPFTFGEQILSYAGQRWIADVSLPRLRRDEADGWRAFFTKLNGIQNTFFLGDPLSKQPKGVVGGVPVLDSANQKGELLSIRGCTPDVVGWLKSGDYIQLGTDETDTRLHMVLDDVNTDSSGKADLRIWPNNILDRPNGDTVITSNAVGVFRLRNGNVMFETDSDSYTRIFFSCVSVVL